MSRTERTHTLPDGRRIGAAYDSESEEWIVDLIGQVSDPVSHRALEWLLEPDQPTLYASGNWFWDAVDQLGTQETPLGRRAPCPCCGFLTMRRGDRLSYELCHVCFWEDDGTQFRNPDSGGGANKVSLREAQRNFREFGACELRCKDKVRPPEPEEHP